VTHFVQDRTLTPAVVEAILALHAALDRQRQDLLELRSRRRTIISAGTVSYLEETAHIRSKAWTVDPLPEGLMERRVELLGGASRSELIAGLNSGARSYIADLWNFTPGDPWNILRAHRNLERAAHLDLAYLPPDGARIRIKPNTITRLIVTPRPMYAMERAMLHEGGPVPASFFDLMMLAHKCAPVLLERQGGLYLYLRDVQGHLEARWWASVFKRVEETLDLDMGSIRATVMLDSIPGALEADEILFELSHHAAGLSFDPQGYAADHIALFHGSDRAVLPDRETIGLNSPFLRSLSLLTIGTCHRRGCHAIGAPSFVLPPQDPDRAKSDYLEMLADKEREAIDGHDGTIVVHSDTVNAAMMEFNKSMPRAHQIYYERKDDISPADLVLRPEGTITVESLLGCVRTALRTMVQRSEGLGWVVQGGRMHDRSSLRLALRLLWQWSHSSEGVITDSGLEIHADLLRFLIRKESSKMFDRSDEHTKASAAKAVEHLLELVIGDELPLEPLDQGPSYLAPPTHGILGVDRRG
jgi:malate synthase